MKPLTLRERRLVAIGLLIALLAFVYLGVVTPLLSGFAERAERRDTLSAQFAQNERMIARIAGLRRTAETLSRDQSRFTLAAPNAEAAGERLKERLGSALERAGGELRSTETVEAPQGWTRAAAAGQMTNDQIVTMLERLQNEPPYLAIEALTIIADRALVSGKLDRMDVKLEASIPFADQR